MSNQNLDHIFGKSGRGDYAHGATITFREGGKEFTGEVIHITAPSKTVSGRQLPTTYEVDCNDGFPHIVTAGQIVEQK
ncbi:hypothetical protein [Dictyobacter formicarum]|uniref:Hypervirulence associated protein TUDOR domain-containing protein n=1 Tax=Dictyobacter formicarum TaxID=2778368 RepID=A0ABQ3VSE7_9CHLR|nr:hypothetical protein [Dictyobacter formicarum]GHO88136.1 hypothetical protein KSZ_61420 [Dictyobacter formicarum]GHO88256.1 hypothetical protein KSZ_62620 [Dictyobacter formicarum]